MKPVTVAATLAMLCTLPTLPAVAQNPQDMDACMNGAGKIPNAQIVGACTRLIEAAAVENEVTGYFYAMRASANSDRQQNCADSRKVVELMTDAKLRGLGEQMVQNNC